MTEPVKKSSALHILGFDALLTLIIGWLSAYLCIASLGYAPILALKSIKTGFLFACITMILLFLATGQSVGMKFFRMGFYDEEGEPLEFLSRIQAYLNLFRRKVANLRTPPNSKPRSMIGIWLVLTSGLVGSFSLWMNSTLVFKHIPLRVVQPESLTLQVDGSDVGIVAPFFYLKGSWPKTFEKRPIFYSIPYETGVPKRFIGDIQVRLDLPKTVLRIEGPKTPLPEVDRGDVEKCFKETPLQWITHGGSLSQFRRCFWIRSKILERAVQEMSAHHPSSWDLEWFSVIQPGLDVKFSPQGLRISAENNEYSQERWIVITPQGRNQALILEQKMDFNNRWKASQLVEKSLASLQVAEDLKVSRAWMESQISQINLTQIQGIEDPLEFGKAIAQVQALLIAQVSIQPADVQAYFHLGGSALLILKRLNAIQKSADGSTIAKLGVLMHEWSASAKPLVQACYLYAKDVGPNLPATQMLQSMWAEANRF